MKLIDLLEILDEYTELVIWAGNVCSNQEEDEQPLFKGIASDVPWSIVHYPLIKDLDGGTCAIRVSQDEKGHTILVISVLDELNT